MFTSMSESVQKNANQKIEDEKKHSILIIDDNMDVLLVMKASLEVEGYVVHTAESSEEAFEVLANILLPKLILLDMQIGEITGLEFLEQLECERPDIINSVPIVFYSGVDSVPKSKAVGFIRKPTDRKIFLREIHRFIEYGLVNFNVAENQLLHSTNKVVIPNTSTDKMNSCK